MNLTLAGYYTTQELQARLGSVSRQAVHDLAKRHNWRGTRVNTTLYPAAQTSEYLAARERTGLLRKLGAPLSGDALIWHDDDDWDCPVDGCNQTAVEWGGKMLCAAGHLSDSAEQYPASGGDETGIKL